MTVCGSDPPERGQLAWSVRSPSDIKKKNTDYITQRKYTMYIYCNYTFNRCTIACSVCLHQLATDNVRGCERANNAMQKHHVNSNQLLLQWRRSKLKQQLLFIKQNFFNWQIYHVLGSIHHNVGR